MSFTVIIPARYGSTRLPGKALADINGAPLVAHVVRQANQSKAQRIIVATDDQRIAKALKNQDCEVCMTAETHQSGSDRLQEVVTKLNIDNDEVVVNVQGDEPMIPPQLIDQVAECLLKSKTAAMSTAAHLIDDILQVENPNVVKVVFNQLQQALYFSRSPIPYNRDGGNYGYWRHIGIYAYRSQFLKSYRELSSSEIEQAESLEQLRVLDNGHQILVHCVDYEVGIGVDTPEDLELVRQKLKA